MNNMLRYVFKLVKYSICIVIISGCENNNTLRAPEINRTSDSSPAIVSNGTSSSKVANTENQEGGRNVSKIANVDGAAEIVKEYAKWDPSLAVENTYTMPRGVVLYARTSEAIREDLSLDYKYFTYRIAGRDRSYSVVELYNALKENKIYITGYDRYGKGDEYTLRAEKGVGSGAVDGKIFVTYRSEGTEPLTFGQFLYYVSNGLKVFGVVENNVSVTSDNKLKVDFGDKQVDYSDSELVDAVKAGKLFIWGAGNNGAEFILEPSQYGYLVARNLKTDGTESASISTMKNWIGSVRFYYASEYNGNDISVAPDKKLEVKTPGKSSTYTVDELYKNIEGKDLLVEGNYLKTGRSFKLDAEEDKKIAVAYDNGFTPYLTFDECLATVKDRFYSFQVTPKTENNINFNNDKLEVEYPVGKAVYKTDGIYNGLKFGEIEIRGQFVPNWKEFSLLAVKDNKFHLKYDNGFNGEFDYNAFVNTIKVHNHRYNIQKKKDNLIIRTDNLVVGLIGKDNILLNVEGIYNGLKYGSITIRGQYYPNGKWFSLIAEDGNKFLLKYDDGFKAYFSFDVLAENLKIQDHRYEIKANNDASKKNIFVTTDNKIVTGISTLSVEELYQNMKKGVYSVRGQYYPNSKWFSLIAEEGNKFFVKYDDGYKAHFTFDDFRGTLKAQNHRYEVSYNVQGLYEALQQDKLIVKGKDLRMPNADEKSVAFTMQAINGYTPEGIIFNLKFVDGGNLPLSAQGYLDSISGGKFAYEYTVNPNPDPEKNSNSSSDKGDKSNSTDPVFIFKPYKPGGRTSDLSTLKYNDDKTNNTVLEILSNDFYVKYSLDALYNSIKDGKVSLTGRARFDGVNYSSLKVSANKSSTFTLIYDGTKELDLSYGSFLSSVKDTVNYDYNLNIKDFNIGNFESNVSISGDDVKYTYNGKTYTKAKSDFLSSLSSSSIVVIGEKIATKKQFKVDDYFFNLNYTYFNGENERNISRDSFINNIGGDKYKYYVIVNE